MKRLLTSCVLLFALTGCASLGGSLNGVLQQLGSFATGVTKWQEMLPAGLGAEQLQALSGYVDQAGNLKETVMGALSGAQDVTKNGFAGILGSLSNMAETPVEQLEGASDMQLRNAINGFTANANDLNQSVTALLENGIPGLENKM